MRGRAAATQAERQAAAQEALAAEETAHRITKKEATAAAEAAAADDCRLRLRPDWDKAQVNERKIEHDATPSSDDDDDEEDEDFAATAGPRRRRGSRSSKTRKGRGKSPRKQAAMQFTPDPYHRPACLFVRLKTFKMHLPRSYFAFVTMCR